ATVDDGSIRATAILLTQQGLADALQGGGDWAEAAPLTLVETERGVLTLWALVKDVVARPQAEAALASLLSQALSLRLRGVMALPAPSPDPAVQEAELAKVRTVFEGVRAEGIPVDVLSMGMSSDLEAAIAQGSTLVRVGTALFGHR
uniref:alanine racemase n=1 Tax=Aquabacterium sp. TaxID=1872578 RepID=UPI0025C1B7D1